MTIDSSLIIYVVEALRLASEVITLLSKEDISKQDWERLKVDFETSQKRRDNAIDALEKLLKE